MKTFDRATLDLVCGGSPPGVCDLRNTSGHPVMLHYEGQRIALAPGGSQELVDDRSVSVSSPGRKTYSGLCQNGKALGIAKDNWVYERGD